MGYTKISGELGGINTSITYFVPLDTNAEIHKVVVKNTSNKKKEIKLFSFVEWCLWNALDDMTNFQRNYNTGEVEVKDSVIYHKTEYKERRNHYAFFSVNSPICGFDSDRESFMGTYNGYHNPDAVMAGKATNSIADGWHPIASHCIQIDLEPGESKELVFLLGYIENDNDDKWESKNVINKKKAEELIKAYSTVEAVDRAFDDLANHWDQLLSKYTIESNDDKLNRMVNIWNQ
jgi:cellobiose phosphorylase